MPDVADAPQDISLTALAVEMGLITQQEAQLAESRRAALQRSGIRLTIGQTLVERRFLDPAAIKSLMREFDRRTAQLGLRRNQFAGVPLRRFGHYELLEILNENSHSRVIKARDTVMDRLVILKILPSSLKADPQWSERFRRETMMLGKLQHPNLVQAYNAQEIDGSPVIAMEYVEGPTVGDRIEREGLLPEKEAWLIGREISKALAYTSRQGIIHRDIKPDNIVCSRAGKVKLIDLGLSKSLAETSHLTVEGTTVGTPFYISPEQARGTRDLDARADIYSLGCTVYHMLTGEPPFWGDQITEVMLKHVEAKRPDPRDLVPELCSGTAGLVMRMMAVHPDKRPQSFEVLVAELAALLPALPKLFTAAQSSTGSAPRRKISSITRIPARTQDTAADTSAALVPVQNGTRKSLWTRFKSWFAQSRAKW